MRIRYRKKWKIEQATGQVVSIEEEPSCSMKELLDEIGFCNADAAPYIRSIIILADMRVFADIRDEFEECFKNTAFIGLPQIADDVNSAKCCYWTTSIDRADGTEWNYVDAIEDAFSILFSSTGSSNTNCKQEMDETIKNIRTQFIRYRKAGEGEEYSIVLSKTESKAINKSFTQLCESGSCLHGFVCEGLILLAEDDYFDCKGRFMPCFIREIYQAEVSYEDLIDDLLNASASEQVRILMDVFGNQIKHNYASIIESLKEVENRNLLIQLTNMFYGALSEKEKQVLQAKLKETEIREQRNNQDVTTGVLYSIGDLPVEMPILLKYVISEMAKTIDKKKLDFYISSINALSEDDVRNLAKSISKSLSENFYNELTNRNNAKSKNENAGLISEPAIERENGNEDARR